MVNEYEESHKNKEKGNHRTSLPLPPRGRGKASKLRSYTNRRTATKAQSHRESCPPAIKAWSDRETCPLARKSRSHRQTCPPVRKSRSHRQTWPPEYHYRRKNSSILKTR